MTRLWHDLSERERLLIVVAAVLAGLVLLFQLGARPLLDARAEAVRAHEAALATLGEIADKAARLDALRARRGTAATPDAAATRLIVGRTAQARGIAIVRLTPEPDGALGLWIENADSATLFAWLVELGHEHGVDVVRADIAATGDAGLQVRLRLAGGGAA